MTLKLIIPTAINQVAYVNQVLISARRRGFDAELTMPSRRERAKAAVYEGTVMKVEESAPTTVVGEFTP